MGSAWAASGALPRVGDDGPAPGVAWSAFEPPRPGRGHLPAWDGDYLLVPAALGGASGTLVLDTFAALLEEHPGLDLVVLADHQPGFQQMARGLGVGQRIHFAGPAPRDAEMAWIASASCTLVSGDGPLSGGLVLRALARGCPLLTVEGGSAADELAPWLEHHGCLAGRVERAGGVGTLERAIAREPAVARALERGRAVAAAATPRSLAERLAAALLPSGERRAA
jgi:hypothetical protein